jgi:hypothetical protein
MAQTTYNQKTGVSAGKTKSHHASISRPTKVALAFGIFAKNDGGELALPDNASNEILGMVLYRRNVEENTEAPVNTDTAVLTRGVGYASTADISVTYNSKAYVVVTGADAGKVTATSTGNIEIGLFDGPVDSGVVPVRINLV